MSLNSVNISLFVLILAGVASVKNQQSDDFCQVDPSGLNILCQNFTSFAQLNLSHFEPVNNQSFKNIEFTPNAPVFLDNSLFLGDLQVANDSYEVTFRWLSGIDILSNPFAEVDPFRKNMLQLVDSKFELLYLNKLIDKQACDYLLQNEIFIPLAATAQLFFLYNPVYSTMPTCQAFFSTADIELFYIANLNDTNRFNFHSNSNVTKDFSSQIVNFNIQSSDFILSDSILDRSVFKTFRSLAIRNSTLRGIQSDLFSYFDFLKAVELELVNFGDFFKSNSNDWLANLNTNVSVDLTNPDDIKKNIGKKMDFFLTDRNKAYVFAAEDLCLFKDFPHSKLVVPIIQTKSNLDCSCTLLWLLKYKSIYDINLSGEKATSNPMYTDSTTKCLNDPNFDKLVVNCQFDINLKQCYSNYTTTTTTKSSNALEGFRTATIVLSLAVVFLVGALGYTIYHFKFRTRTNYQNVDK